MVEGIENKLHEITAGLKPMKGSSSVRDMDSAMKSYSEKLNQSMTSMKGKYNRTDDIKPTEDQERTQVSLNLSLFQLPFCFEFFFSNDFLHVFRQSLMTWYSKQR